MPHEKQLGWLGETEIVDCKIPSYVEHTHKGQGQVIWMRECRHCGIRTGCQQLFKPMTPPHPSNIKRKPPRGKKFKFVLMLIVTKQVKVWAKIPIYSLTMSYPLQFKARRLAPRATRIWKRITLFPVSKGKDHKVYHNQN